MLAAGTSLGPYKILAPIGAGGMGEVYRASDTRLGRDVALKVLPAQLAGDPDRRARFEREAKAVSALNHPNICTIHDIGEEAYPAGAEPRMFIVMEYVQGQMLQERKSSLNLRQAVDIGIQVAEGLAAAHEKGIVHRDIKPENIMIRKDGIAQIMDFSPRARSSCIRRTTTPSPPCVTDRRTAASRVPRGRRSRRGCGSVVSLSVVCLPSRSPSTMLWAKAEGYRWLGLGMAPLSGLPDHQLAPLWSRLGRFMFRHGAQFYNFQGLRAYKEKFGPVWTPIYLSSARRAH